MGTTLTGTTPQDTYDSLIKVTDNGPLSGSLKTLTDGLGNDSSLSLSTTAASLSGTLAVTGNAAFDTNTLFVDAANDRVGVGTATPDQRLDIRGSETTAYVASSASLIAPAGGVNLNIANTGAAGYSSIRFVSLNGSNAFGYLGFNNNTGSVGGSFVLGQRTGGDAYSEQVRINESGNVGIGTSTIFYKLQANTESTGNAVIAGFVNPSAANNTTKGASISLGLADTVGNVKDAAFLRAFAGNANVTTGGLAIDVRKVDGVPVEVIRITPAGVLELAEGQIKFPATQVPSADANTLDDYEEGTWTPSLGGDTTYSAQAGTYTKIGRQVVLNFAVGVTTLGTGSQSTISGLPFTSQSVSRGGGGVAFVQNPSTAYASINPLVSVSSPFVTFVTSTTAGSWADQSNVFTDGTIISGTITYFV